MGQTPRKRGAGAKLALGVIISLVVSGGGLMCARAGLVRILVRHPHAGWIDDERRQLQPWSQPAGDPDLYLGPTRLRGRDAGDLAAYSEVALCDRQAIATHRPAIDSILEQNQAYMTGMASASHDDYVAPPPTFTEPKAGSWGALRSTVRGHARTSTVAAAVAHVDGDDDRALDICADVRRVAHAVPRGGGIVDQIIGVACHSIIARTEVTILLEGGVDRDRCLEQASLLRELRENPWPLSESLRAEAEQSVLMYEATRTGDMAALSSSPSASGRRVWAMRAFGPAISESRTWYEDRMARGIEGADKPWWEQDALGFWDRAEADADDRGDTMAGILMPVFGKGAAKLVSNDAALAALEIMCGLEAYRCDHGEYPEELESLAPEYLPDIPIDPWTENSMVYDRDAREPYLLYALGPNGVADAAECTVKSPYEPDQRFVPPVWLEAK